MLEASYYEIRSNNKVKCNLCPHECIISENHSGICQIRKNINGKLYSITYEEISSIALDPIEKKPLYHFYPSKNILSIGSNGCNLKCPFCQNWQISMNLTERQKINFDSILQSIKETQSIGIAYTYNEPLISYEFLYEYSKKIRENNLKNVIVSNGMINEEPLIKISPYIDAANIDIKGFSESFYKYVNGDFNTVKNTIKILYKHNVHIELTFLLIPTKNDNEQEFHNLCRFIAEINKEIPLHISRYFPNYKENIPPTDLNLLKQFYDIAKSYLFNVYVGNANIIETKNTYCPNCGKILIERNFHTKIYIKDSKCPNCSYSPYLVS
jgi:pyruvate formate lyase activating enzyme